MNPTFFLILIFIFICHQSVINSAEEKEESTPRPQVLLPKQKHVHSITPAEAATLETARAPETTFNKLPRVTSLLYLRTKICPSLGLAEEGKVLYCPYPNRIDLATKKIPVHENSPTIKTSQNSQNPLDLTFHHGYIRIFFWGFMYDNGHKQHVAVPDEYLRSPAHIVQIPRFLGDPTQIKFEITH